MTEQDEKHDLAADLAICEAATKGPVKWRRYGGQYMLEGEYGSRPIILSTTWEETEEGDIERASIELAVGDERGMLWPLTPEHPDARRIAESWEGWPHAIRRAMEAEARVKELEAEAAAMKEALQAHRRSGTLRRRRSGEMAKSRRPRISAGFQRAGNGRRI